MLLNKEQTPVKATRRLHGKDLALSNQMLSAITYLDSKALVIDLKSGTDALFLFLTIEDL